MSRIRYMTTCNSTFRFVPSKMRSIAFYLLVFALVLRSLIPAGFMPHFDASSSKFISLEICTPDGAYLIDVPIDDESSGKHQMAVDHQQPCAFGSFAVQLFKADLHSTEIAFSPHTSLATLHETSVDQPYFTIFGAPLGSRAPPLSASI